VFPKGVPKWRSTEGRPKRGPKCGPERGGPQGSNKAGPQRVVYHRGPQKRDTPNGVPKGGHRRRVPQVKSPKGFTQRSFPMGGPPIFVKQGGPQNMDTQVRPQKCSHKGVLLGVSQILGPL
jgi:hypothetical protein